jgi:hypothetical protein
MATLKADLPRWATSGATVTEPSEADKSLGWDQNPTPVRAHANWKDLRAYEALLDLFKSGVAQYASDMDYPQYGMAHVPGVGTVECVNASGSTGNDPETDDGSNWLNSAGIHIVDSTSSPYGIPLRDGTMIIVRSTLSRYIADGILPAAGTILDGSVVNITTGSSGSEYYDFALPKTTVAATNTGVDYYSEPRLARLADGDVICVYRRGSAHSSDDGKVVGKISSDNGATWGSEFDIHDDASYDTRNQACGVDPSSGRVIVFDRTYNAGGAVHVSTYYLTSTDNGSTWSSPTSLDSLFSDLTYDYMIPFGPMVTTSNGLAQVFYGIRASTNQQFAYLLFSTDGGATWGDRHEIYSVTQAAATQTEPAIVAIDNDRLALIIRDDQDGSRYFWTRSLDGGYTWETTSGKLFDWTTATLTDNGSPVAMALMDNELLIAWGVRAADYSLYAVRVNKDLFFRSPPTGFTEPMRRMWRSNIELGSAVKGDFGYPSILTIPGVKHTALCAWYDSHDGNGSTDTDIFIASMPRY